jgi:hypothetical protein
MAAISAARAGRTRRWPPAVAWALWTLAVLGLAVPVWVDHLLRAAGRPDLVVVIPSAISPVLGGIGVATVGAVLSSRRPAHPVGWLMLGMGLSLSAAASALAYAHYGMARGGSAPGVGLVAPYLPATIVVAIACNGLILLLTPTGSLPSSRWRWWAWLTAATLVALLLVVTVGHRPSDRQVDAIDSPLDLHALDGALLAAYQVAFAVMIAASWWRPHHWWSASATPTASNVSNCAGWRWPPSRSPCSPCSIWPH